jgi:hypothetical protein
MSDPLGGFGILLREIRDKESNLDLHVQSVVSCRLDDPGAAGRLHGERPSSIAEHDLARRACLLLCVRGHAVPAGQNDRRMVRVPDRPLDEELLVAHNPATMSSRGSQAAAAEGELEHVVVAPAAREPLVTENVLLGSDQRRRRHEEPLALPDVRGVPALEPITRAKSLHRLSHCHELRMRRIAAREPQLPSLPL